MVFAKLFEYLFLYGVAAGVVALIILETFIFGIIYLVKSYKKEREHIMYEVILLNEKRRKIQKRIYKRIFI